MKNTEKNEKLRSLCEQEEEAQKELKKEKQKVKIIQNRIKDLKRRERTHRLCTHGALLEKFFPPEEFTDEMILFLLNGSFNRQNETVRKIMEDVKEIFSSGDENESS